MRCTSPLSAFRTPTGVVFDEKARHDIIDSVSLPCGRCMACRVRRASDWELRIMHEAQLWPQNCAVTLTYAPGNLPPAGSLLHRDFQLFMKRLRQNWPFRVRFFVAGEYGDENRRPHFHACLFNVDFPDRVLGGRSGSGELFYHSAFLDRLWGLGRASVQDLVPQTAAYAARYVTKKFLGEGADAHYSVVDGDGVVTRIKSEYCASSLKPGIGAGWFERFGRSVFPHDFVIADGVRRRPPKYYDRLLKRSNVSRLEDVQYARYLKSRDSAGENTDERLAAQDVVLRARLSSKLRSL